MRPFLETCTLEEVYEALGGNEKLLVELRERLRDWLTSQPHLPQDIPERLLEYFVISTKLSLEQAKQKLDMYYTVRRLVPELFANRDPLGPSITNLHRTLQWICLPKLTPQKYRVSILRSIDEDPTRFHPWDLFKYTFMVGDVRVSEYRSLGEIYIYDLSAMRLGHLAKLTPTMLKRCEVVATKAYGARIKGIHFVNVPNFIDRIISLVKLTIKPKLSARIHVHSSGYESLYEFVPKSILPKDYGGNEAPAKELSDMWRDKLEEWRNWFLEQQEIFTDESRRPGPTVNDDSLFGLSGSFRKLEVD